MTVAVKIIIIFSDMKKRFEFEDIFYILMLSVMVVGIAICIASVVMHKPDEVVRETADKIYVKHYNMFGTSSEIIEYSQPKIHDGVVTHKERTRHFRGVVGKGGHWVTRYNITIEFNGKTIRYNDRYLYEKYEKGSVVKIKESWYNGKYGCYQIDIL
jgi:hypothetical protein